MEPHGSRPFDCHWGGVGHSGEGAKVEPGKRVEAASQPCQRGASLAELFGERTKYRPDAGRLGRGNCHESLELPALRQQCKRSADCLVRVKFAHLSATAEEVEHGGFRLRQTRPRLGPAGVNNRVRAYEFPGQTVRAGRKFALYGGLGGEAEQIGRRRARWEERRAPRSQAADG